MMSGSSSLPDVAFVCHAYHRGGVTRWMVDAAVAWRELGGRAWLLAPSPPGNGHASPRPSVIGLALDAENNVRPEIVTWRLDATFELGTANHRAFTYAKVIEHHVPLGVPMILSDDPAVWAGAAMLCARNPLVGVIHSDEATYYGYVRHYRNELSGIVCVSRRTRDRVVQTLERPELPIETIPCGVPVSDEHPQPDRRPDGEPRIVWVGRMEESSKRVSDLPKIARALRDASLPCRFDLIGDGPARAELAENIARSDLSFSMTLHGWSDRDAVRSILENADLFLLPSNFEGMSVSLMEALASGCAVVSSSTSGIEDYATHDGAARCVWTFPVGDVAAAVQCVCDALSVPRAERQQRSLSFARSEFSIERCVRAYASFVRRLRPPARDTGQGSRVIRAHLSAIASRPIAAWRSARLSRSMR